MITRLNKDDFHSDLNLVYQCTFFTVYTALGFSTSILTVLKFKSLIITTFLLSSSLFKICDFRTRFNLPCQANAEKLFAFAQRLERMFDKRFVVKGTDVVF